MRLDLFYNPRLLLERVAAELTRRSRLARLRKTPARTLQLGHIDSLELLELSKAVGINTIYDVGANIGTWTLLAKSILPEARIHAFEPLERLHTRFYATVAGVEDVTLHSVALGAENRTAAIHITDFVDASSLLTLNRGGQVAWNFKEVEEVATPLCRLDDFRKQQDLPSPDLIKLDVQGYELEVLRGAEDSLTHAKAIIAEVSFERYYENQCLFHEIVRFLADRGLFIQAFSSTTPLGTSVGQTDVLFGRAENRVP
jgi:FkbM family methyltransferase